MIAVDAVVKISSADVSRFSSQVCSSGCMFWIFGL
jgi:hypothetical protein